MAARRKPAPRAQSPVNEPMLQPMLQSDPVDPQLTRYSLSDGPATYDQISNAVDQMVETYSNNEGTNKQSDPFRDGASSVGGHSSNESNAYSQPSTSEFRRYQPGQYLAPIITGETLQIEPEPTPPSTTHSDPFYDPTTPLSSGSLPLIVPPEQSYNNTQEGHASSTYHSYASSYDHSTLPAGSEIDHFNYDTEAYASGNNSRASYRPRRSRSPTPAVDDEDYLIVGDESIHYTGYPGYPEEQYSHGAEKKEKESPYYKERGYLPNGHEVVYDPEPETPTSTLYSLPPDQQQETRHFGPAPVGRILRRHKTKRRVQLTNGNLVVDLDVPPKLRLPRRGEPETMKTRYTAVTCDPDDFEKKGFFLRQNESGRRTEMFIVITMYNVGSLVLALDFIS
ncbi:hypothetical protein CVT25_013526 [Psilocybe cyanescens]|uniref:Chitin synthase N-terminal domain-containing protein n=1 Tax=Psilocybe cyanescens TaxID=93625 RepID=A0A409XT06_PSICY|nr:hypothetical protein CVT25_013526 [Psilocybe cyanescens]